MDRASLKAMAKSQVKGNLVNLLIITVLYFLISLAAGAIPYVGSVAGFILSAGFSLSMVMIFLGLTQGNGVTIGDMFKGFNDLWAAIKLYFLMGLKIALWSMLFMIPGIVKSFSYAMAPYILAENPGMSARAAINRSKEMMEGHKMELFILQFSFIGWAIVSVFTFGLLLIWLVPYMGAATANFYNAIKGSGSSGSTVEAAGYSDADFSFGSDGPGFDFDHTDFGAGTSGPAAGSQGAPAQGSGTQDSGASGFSADDMAAIDSLTGKF